MQQQPDFGMVAEERNVKVDFSILKHETQREARAAFKQLVSELSNAEPSMRVWPAKDVNQVT